MLRRLAAILWQRAFSTAEPAHNRLRLRDHMVG
jgi:hypothetical protein